MVKLSGLGKDFRLYCCGCIPRKEELFQGAKNNNEEQQCMFCSPTGFCQAQFSLQQTGQQMKCVRYLLGGVFISPLMDSLDHGLQSMAGFFLCISRRKENSGMREPSAAKKRRQRQRMQEVAKTGCTVETLEGVWRNGKRACYPSQWEMGWIQNVGNEGLVK